MLRRALKLIQIDMKDGYEPVSGAFEGHDAVFCCLGMLNIKYQTIREQE